MKKVYKKVLKNPLFLHEKKKLFKYVKLDLTTMENHSIFVVEFREQIYIIHMQKTTTKATKKRLTAIKKHLAKNHIQLKALPGITKKSYKTCSHILNGVRNPSYIDTFLTAIEQHYSIN